MEEQSHLDEMRAALRGERERAEEARRRTLENVLSVTAQAASEEPAEPPRKPRRRLLRRR